ncbi:MAG TPA: hypothetical protein VFC93_03080 [Chloroflexota bacterium]|nr:hypothetical protein [Chloroflexota bacterium]
MRSGRFERGSDADGTPVYRLRWDNQAEPLNGLDLRRLEFLRYLLRTGRVTDGAVEP